MKSKLTFTKHLDLPKSTKELIKAHVEWELSPESIVKGRSGYVHLPEPISGTKISLLKFKGLGYFDPENKISLKPGQSTYDGGKQVNDLGITELANRLIVTKDGQFKLEELEVKPFGGQYLDRVKTEFEVAETLFSPDMPMITYAPIAYAEYIDIKFNEKPLGVVILGLPSDQLTFLEEYFVFRRQGEQMLISDRFSPRATPPQFYEVLHNFCIEIGAKLRVIHQHFVGIEGHLGNCTIIPQTHEVLLHDLDFVHQVSALTPIQQFNYPIRDIASYLTAIITNLLFSDLLDFAPYLQDYEENYFHFNFLKGLIYGYEDAYPDALEDYFDHLWKDLLVFYNQELAAENPQQRLVKIHPYIVTQKASMLNELYQLMSHIWKTSGRRPLSTKNEHLKNVQNVLKSVEKSAED